MVGDGSPLEQSRWSIFSAVCFVSMYHLIHLISVLFTMRILAPCIAPFTPGRMLPLTHRAGNKYIAVHW